MEYGTPMTNTTDYQILEQLRTLNDNYQKAAQSQERYMAMQQSFNQMNSQGNQMGTLNRNLAGGSNIISSQAAGLYSGFGIQPGQISGLLNNISPNVNNTGLQQIPFNNSVNQQAIAQSQSLAAATFKAGMSNATMYMTPEQRSQTAGRLATSWMQTGNKVMGTVGDVGGVVGTIGLSAGVGALAGGGVPGFAIGTAAGLAVSAAAPALEGITTSSTLNFLTGGKLGWNSKIWHPTEAISEELSEQEALTGYLNQSSYRMMGTGYNREFGRMGLTRSDSQAWSKSIRQFDSKFNISDSDVQSLLASGIESGTLKGFNTFDQFEKKFSEQVEYIKNASRILNKSFQEISDLMSEFEKSGISSKNFDLSAAKLKSYSASIGKDVDTVKAYLLSASNITQGTSMSTENVGFTTLTNATVLKRWQDDILNNGGNPEMQNYFANNNGALGTAAQLNNVASQVFSNQTASTLLSAFMKPTANGFSVSDPAALQAALQQAQSGNLNVAGLQDMASANMSGWSANDKARWVTNGSQYLMSQDSLSTNALLQTIALASGNTNGLGTRSALELMYGLTPDQSMMASGYFDYYNKYGSQDILNNEILGPMQIVNAARQEEAAASASKWGYNKTTLIADKFADLAAVDISDMLANTYEDWMNSKSGYGAYKAMYDTPYSTIKYDFTKGFGTPGSYNTTDSANAAIANIKGVMKKANVYESYYGKASTVKEWQDALVKIQASYTSGDVYNALNTPEALEAINGINSLQTSSTGAISNSAAGSDIAKAMGDVFGTTINGNATSAILSQSMVTDQSKSIGNNIYDLISSGFSAIPTAFGTGMDTPIGSLVSGIGSYMGYSDTYAMEDLNSKYQKKLGNYISSRSNLTAEEAKEQGTLLFTEYMGEVSQYTGSSGAVDIMRSNAVTTLDAVESKQAVISQQLAATPTDSAARKQLTAYNNQLSVIQKNLAAVESGQGDFNELVKKYAEGMSEFSLLTGQIGDASSNATDSLTGVSDKLATHNELFKVLIDMFDGEISTMQEKTGYTVSNAATPSAVKKSSPSFFSLFSGLF